MAPHLSVPQRVLLELLAQGMSYRQMRTRLSLKQGTIQTHLSLLYKALGANNQTRAVARAYELGLLGPKSDPALTDPVWLDIDTVIQNVLAIENREGTYWERAAFARCRDLVVAEIARHGLTRASELDGSAA